MLTLSRGCQERIMVGDDIVITVIEIRGEQVRLGISAPDAVAVDREEVYEAKRRNGRDLQRMPSRLR